MDEFTLFQQSLKEHKKETDERYKKMEDHVQTMVDKVHEGALALTVIATELKDVPHARHLEEHDWTQDKMSAEREEAEFWRALKLSLASKFGWKLLIVLGLMLVGFIWHHDEIKEWVFTEFLSKEVSEVVSGKKN